MAIASSYSSRMMVRFGFGLAVALAVGFVAGRIARIGTPGENFWLVYPALLAVFTVMFAAMMPWWRRLDDLQKSGNLLSWYWGGQIGAIVVLTALVARYGPKSDLTKGGAAVFLGEAAFFGIAWLIWRIRLRGPDE